MSKLEKKFDEGFSFIAEVEACVTSCLAHCQHIS